jgi:hypothetical protein
MIQNETVRNVLATVAAAALVGGGAQAYRVGSKVDQHDIKITSIEKRQDEILKKIDDSNQQLHEEVVVIGNNVGEIKTGVAVLEERTVHLERAGGKPRT